jgi:hypothetical protein
MGPRKRVMFVGALLVWLWPVVCFGNDYSLVPSQYGMELKAPNGNVVLEYKTVKPPDIGLTAPSAAYFDPINTPGGERVTNVAPDDHPHHRGMFFGFIDSEFRTPMKGPYDGTLHAPEVYRIQRADFWAWGFYAPRDNRVIQNKDIKLTYADSQRAQLEIHNDWLVEGKKMLDETDQVSVEERDGVYVIDVIYRLAPLVEYVINRQAFGGFAVQGQKAGTSYYANASGKVNLPSPNPSNVDLDWPSEPWYDYTITLANDGKTVGFAVIDHPENPPTRWHNTVWFLNPNITSFRDTTIYPDAPLSLRYRVVVHDGDTPTEELQKLSVEWRAKPHDITQ